MTLFFDNRQSLPLPEGIENTLLLAVDAALFVCDFTKEYEASLSFVNEEEIRALNREYRGQDRITDVLSFPAELDVSLPVIPLGDIVLCPARAGQQAEEIGHSTERELIYLTIHSVLHLLGYDHMDPADKEAMRTKEKEAMTEVKHVQEKTGYRL